MGAEPVSAAARSRRTHDPGNSSQPIWPLAHQPRANAQVIDLGIRSAVAMSTPVYRHGLLGTSSGLGVTLAGSLLCDVDAAVDLLAVLAAGALIGDVARLLHALVDLLVVLVGVFLRLVHEPAHVCLLGLRYRRH